MAVSIKLAVVFVGFTITTRVLLFGVYMRAPDVWKLPASRTPTVETLGGPRRW